MGLLSSTDVGVYSDLQVTESVKELFDIKSFVSGMQAFLPLELSELFLKVNRGIQNSFEFQRDIIRPLLRHIEAISMSSLSGSGLESLDPAKKYLFISNHRDIGLDSAFVNLLLFDAGFTTSQIAIGDNLMKHRIAELIFKINKSFVVRRTGKPRELYQSSIAMSKYIYSTITTGLDSVWIAQREGRAKDGNDFTQISLLKMLGLNGRENLKAHLTQLNIVPVSISYEYDPCDYLKTREYIDRQKSSEYQKTFNADMASILQGMKGRKGKVHIAFGQPINDKIAAIPEDLHDKNLLGKLASIIDHQILSSYEMNPINYIAADLLNANTKYTTHYNEELSTINRRYFDRILSKFSKADYTDAKQYLLGIYANPLINRTNLAN